MESLKGAVDEHVYITRPSLTRSRERITWTIHIQPV